MSKVLNIILVGGNPDRVGIQVKALAKAGVRVVKAWVFDGPHKSKGRWAKAPRVRGCVDAVVVMADLIPHSGMPEAKRIAADAHAPLVNATRRVAVMVPLLRDSGLTWDQPTNGGENMPKPKKKTVRRWADDDKSRISGLLKAGHSWERISILMDYPNHASLRRVYSGWATRGDVPSVKEIKRSQQAAPLLGRVPERVAPPRAKPPVVVGRLGGAKLVMPAGSDLPPAATAVISATSEDEVMDMMRDYEQKIAALKAEIVALAALHLASEASLASARAASLRAKAQPEEASVAEASKPLVTAAYWRGYRLAVLAAKAGLGDEVETAIIMAKQEAA